MSRIGKMPVVLPKGVEVKQANGTLSVKGPKGSLQLSAHPDMNVVIDGGEVRVERPSDEKQHRALHGLTRSLITNMVIGVTDGFAKTLEIVGVGYRADLKGKGLTLSLGFSHTIEYTPDDGVSLECPNQTTIVVSGIDKQKVGQAAADIRAFGPPEPYKGKGVKYAEETIIRKEGKKK